MWSEPVSSALPLLKQRIVDQEIQIIIGNLSAMRKATIYRNIVRQHSIAVYLCKSIPNNILMCITKLRLLAHTLEIDSGRYYNVPSEERIKKLCVVDIEDESHFLLKCTQYMDLRKLYINMQEIFEIRIFL